jgi:WD40 repeat protein
MSSDVSWALGGFNKSCCKWLTTICRFFPDGTRIIILSGNLIRVWDATTGAEVLSPLAVHTAEVNSSVVSADGLASGWSDHIVRLWDAIIGDALLLYSLDSRHPSPWSHDRVLFWPQHSP